MSQPPIRCRYRWSFEELKSAQRSESGQKNSRAFGWLANAIAAFFVFDGGVGLLRLGFSRSDLYRLLGGLTWFALRYHIYPRLLRNGYEERPDRGKEVEWEIDEDGFSQMTDVSEFRTRWDSITKVAESPSGFHLYMGPTIYWLPKHAFASTDDVDRFRRIVESRWKPCSFQA